MTFNQSSQKQPKTQATLTLYSEQDTQKLAMALAQLPLLIGSVWLSGDLGAGKTTLTRYWLQALGHTGAVKSPTYTLVEPYQLHQPSTKNDDSLLTTNPIIKNVYHADLYRLQDPEELSFIGFDEYLDDPNALIIIEWASRADDYLPPPNLFINIYKNGEINNTDINNNVKINDKPSSNHDCRQVELQISQAGLALGLDLQNLQLELTS